MRARKGNIICDFKTAHIQYIVYAKKWGFLTQNLQNRAKNNILKLFKKTLKK